MIKIVEFVMEYWKVFITIGVLIVLLSMTGNITVSLRAAKNGIRESTTPLGMFVLIILAAMIWYLYNQFISM